MLNLYDLAYLTGLTLAAPVWLVFPKARHKTLDALRTRRALDLGALPAVDVMIHAVSVGEINAASALIHGLLDQKSVSRVLLTTTTLTGLTRAKQLQQGTPGLHVIRSPIDLTGPIRRLLDVARPRVVVLMELEVWPNFMKHCQQRNIPVLIGNGRITQPSWRRYQWGMAITRRMFSRVTKCLAQDAVHARRFEQLGIRKDRIEVAGTMKFDSAPTSRHVEGSDQLYQELAIHPGVETVLVCGSTGPGEEELCLDAFLSLRVDFPELRLMLVPRKPERFGEVARLIESHGLGLTRRTQRRPAGSGDIVLLDTMGELRKAYAGASLVFVGRSLVDLGPKQHGSDMIEACALGKPVVTGPFTGNFEEPMRMLLQAQAILQTPDLKGELRRLLDHPDHAQAMGERAAAVVDRCRGATSRHIETILGLLNATTPLQSSV